MVRPRVAPRGRRLPTPRNGKGPSLLTHGCWFNEVYQTAVLHRLRPGWTGRNRAMFMAAARARNAPDPVDLRA
jgi:hypothetical protein